MKRKIVLGGYCPPPNKSCNGPVRPLSGPPPPSSCCCCCCCCCPGGVVCAIIVPFSPVAPDTMPYIGCPWKWLSVYSESGIMVITAELSVKVSVVSTPGHLLVPFTE